MPLAFLDRWYLSLFGPVLITAAAALVYLLPWLVTTKYYFRAKHFANRIWLWLTDERTGPLRPARMSAITRARDAAKERLAAVKQRAQAVVLESETAKRAKAAAMAAAEAAKAKVKDNKALSTLASTAAGAAAVAEKETAVADFDNDDSDADEHARGSRGRTSPGVPLRSLNHHHADDGESASESDPNSSESGSSSNSGSYSSSDGEHDDGTLPGEQHSEERSQEKVRHERSAGSGLSVHGELSHTEPNLSVGQEHTTSEQGTETMPDPHASISAEGPRGGSAAADRPGGPKEVIEETLETERQPAEPIIKDSMFEERKTQDVAGKPYSINDRSEASEKVIEDNRQESEQPRPQGFPSGNRRHHHRRRRRRKTRVAFEGNENLEFGSESRMLEGDGEVEGVKGNDSVSDKIKQKAKKSGAGMFRRTGRRQTTWGAAAAHFRSQCLDSAVRKSTNGNDSLIHMF